MEPFKIEYFREGHPGVELPWFQTLSGPEALEISNRLTSKLGFRESPINPLQLVETVYSKSVFVEGLNAEKDGFSLASVFEKVGVSTPEFILINWYRFDRITRMKSANVIQYFDDVWYPGPDDIDLFPESLEWILLVDHAGYMNFLRLTNAAT